MTHFHYDRFDTPDDEQYGKWSVNFRTNPQGDIEQAVMSLDEGEGDVHAQAREARSPRCSKSSPEITSLPPKSNSRWYYQPGAGLSIVFSGAPPEKLIPIKGLKFRTPQFADDIYEFVMENGKVTALKERNPEGEFTYTRQ